VWRILEEHQDAACYHAQPRARMSSKSSGKELAQEAWQENRWTEEVKRNLQRLQPLVEKYGY
jgi:hypothetical protein